MYSEVLIAKYGGSMINDVHTISPADFVHLPAKSHGQPHSFQKRKQFLYDLCVSHRPSDLGVSTWIATSKMNFISERVEYLA